MGETVAVIAGVSAVALIIAAIVAITLFTVTRYGAVYKSFKKPVKTTGIVDAVEYAASHSDEGEDHFIIRYSYTDGAGARHTAQFKWQRRIYEAGDKIVLHFDSQNPGNCIADCQLNYGRSAWWKALLVLAALFIPAFVIAFLFTD